MEIIKLGQKIAKMEKVQSVHYENINNQDLLFVIFKDWKKRRKIYQSTTSKRNRKIIKIRKGYNMNNYSEKQLKEFAIAAQNNFEDAFRYRHSTRADIWGLSDEIVEKALEMLDEWGA